MFPPSLSSTTRQPGSTRQSCPTTTTCTAPGSVSLQDNQAEEEEEHEEEEKQEEEEEQEEELVFVLFQLLPCKHHIIYGGVRLELPDIVHSSIKPVGSQ